MVLLYTLLYYLRLFYVVPLGDALILLGIITRWWDITKDIPPTPFEWLNVIAKTKPFSHSNAQHHIFCRLIRLIGLLR